MAAGLIWFENDDRGIKLKRLTVVCCSQEVLNVVCDLLINHSSEAPSKKARLKLVQLKSVLEMCGHFSVINRKRQIKYRALDFSVSKPGILKILAYKSTQKLVIVFPENESVTTEENVSNIA